MGLWNTLAGKVVRHQTWQLKFSHQSSYDGSFSAYGTFK